MLMTLISGASFAAHQAAVTCLPPCPEICTGSLQREKMDSSQGVFPLLLSGGREQILREISDMKCMISSKCWRHDETCCFKRLVAITQLGKVQVCGKRKGTHLRRHLLLLKQALV
uniref:Uncharacterized protein MANES_12G144700 n=1 Tax=Rhizophora mucronata TaxID=61149 RepID=A0A2P2NRQ4_RHIMU